MNRNKELRSIMLKVLVLGLLFLIIAIFTANIFIDNIKESIIDRDFSIVGNLVERYPEDKEKIISSITKDSNLEDIEKGKDILKRYGYERDIKSTSQPLMRNSERQMVILLTIFIFLFLFSLMLLIYFEYKKMYRKVNDLSRASEQFMDGDFSNYLDDSGEGDFNILNHQFNQMAGRLENSLDVLQAEKIYLKDTISNISHQLKTPLSALIVLNDILLKDIDMEKGLRVDFLEKTNSQLNRMEWLILNLLKLARIEAGSIEFKEEDLYLKEIVDLALNSLKPLMKDTEVEIKGDLNSKFIGDLDWTVEALINIIKNGVEHGRGKILIEIEETPLFSSIIIIDNGKGISAKELPNIFKRFYKGVSGVKPDSIGIGLNLSKLIVESQGGLISVDSKNLEGTKFSIRFLKKKLDKNNLKM